MNASNLQESTASETSRDKIDKKTGKSVLMLRPLLYFQRHPYKLVIFKGKNKAHEIETTVMECLLSWK